MSGPIAFDHEKLERPVTREELYFIVRQVQNLVLASRYESAAHRMGGPSLVDAMESFQKAEKDLQVMLDELVRRKEML